MNTPLTDQQRELLSAWLDAEVTQAERATVETLLQREDAKQYVESLRATTALLAAHSAVRAPVGLSGRVMNALEGEFKPKAVGPGSEPFTSIPTLSWRAPLYAAAAAILVALGIMFGPALTTSTPTDGVARTPLENLQAKPADQPASEDVVEDPKVLDALEEKAPDSYEAEGLDRANEKFRRVETKKTWGEEDDSKTADLEKSSKEAREELKNDPARDGRNASPKPAKSEANPRDEVSKDAGDKNRENAEGEEDEGAALGKVSGGRSSPGGSKGSESDRPTSRGDDSGGGSGAGAAKKDKTAAPTPPAEAPMQDADDKESGQGGTTIEISNADTIAAQTDVLWISSLYGDAELTDEEADMESVSVEIDPAKLPELMAALRKLAKDQGYGEVAGDAAETQALDRKREQAHGISGYLPTDEDEQPATAAPAPNAPKLEAEEKPAEKVRIVIRLK